ncbi:MAG: phosphoribosylformylglycinamidine synthase II, partial [Micavibrio sp.]|nr:phosphoribosylformylglycinamidine synthase II [Micavibrio sp.]
MTQAALKIEDLKEPVVTESLGKEFGLNSEEYALVSEILGRLPTYTELGIFSVMWSEHCSYKSSRIHLAKLPTSAPWVIQGPGENAGVIDIGDNQALIFKMESHNHPSFIEPFNGAATGVGGIMRDVFTMGARPIANLNALRFGEPDNPKTRHILAGVVKGISHYGNCMGVPTVAGETQFHARYNGNPLVNAMTIGLADQDKIFYSKGAEPHQPVVYVGAKTGRDGIHGATMASTEFGEGAEEKRPTVQVGDPFTEKLLLEACLELMQEDAIVCIQDMGAAGLTSSSVEIADKGGIGVTLDLDKVPQRETAMIPYEIMLSESQERMLMILKPGSEEKAKAIFDKWDLDFAVIGETNDTKQLKLNMYGKTWCDIPVPPLVDKAPKYDRPHVPTPKQAAINNADFALPNNDPFAVLEKLMSCPDTASKAWIWEQYDSLVMGETRYMSGQSDAAIVKIPNHDKALATSSDCNPRYCFADPYEGGKQIVAESYRNLCATGATPLAVTNNLNFGNPEKPEIMGQFVGCLKGMGEACLALDYPVISGNVSLYNETNGEAILPTPVIGGVGMIKDWKKAKPLAFQNENETIMLIGGEGTHLGQSLYLKEVFGLEQGPAPTVELSQERKNGEYIRSLTEQNLITACHDISDGGLLVALAEMAIASNIGAELEIKADAATLYGEDQARYVITTTQPDKIQGTIIGKTSGKTLKLEAHEVKVEHLRQINQSWLPNYMR